MERNDSNDQITIDQETLNEIEDQIKIDQKTLDMHINDLNLASLLKKICSKKRFEQLQKIQNYVFIIETLNKSGKKDLVEIFLNLDLKKLAVLSEFTRIDMIILYLHDSGGQKFVNKFLSFPLAHLQKLKDIKKLELEIYYTNKFEGMNGVKKLLNKNAHELFYIDRKPFFNLCFTNTESVKQTNIDQETLNEIEDQITIDQETLDMHINDLNLASLLKKICSKKRFEQLKKIQNYSSIIEDLNYFGRKELAEIFLNLPLESLKALSEINFPWSIIQNLNKSGGPELVKKFFKLDPSSLARITYSIISGLNKRELVEEFFQEISNINGIQIEQVTNTEHSYPSEQQTNMNVDNIQQFLNNNKIENQNQMEIN